MVSVFSVGLLCELQMSCETLIETTLVGLLLPCGQCGHFCGQFCGHFVVNLWSMCGQCGQFRGKCGHLWSMVVNFVVNFYLQNVHARPFGMAGDARLSFVQNRVRPRFEGCPGL